MGEAVRRNFGMGISVRQGCVQTCLHRRFDAVAEETAACTEASDPCAIDRGSAVSPAGHGPL
ncbi:hypothetical protein GCM10010398_13820 [Streptomyces fimbriatus]